MRRGEGVAPAEDSAHRCHLALTQEESETGGLGGMRQFFGIFFSLIHLCIQYTCVLCNVCFEMKQRGKL